MRMNRCVSIGLAPLLVSGCQDIPGPDLMGPPLSLEIVDAAHGGRDGFHFLPPLVPDPRATGTFDPAFLPFLAVEICEWDGTACVGPLVARFTSEEGPDGEVIRIHDHDGDDTEENDEDEDGDPDDEDDGDDEDEGRYEVKWETEDFDVNLDRHYRIRVLAGSVELGHADVDIVSSSKEEEEVDTGTFVALREGHALPIKFRIETSLTGVGVVGVGGGRVEEGLGAATVVVPSGSFVDVVLVSIEEVAPPPTDLVPITHAFAVRFVDLPALGASAQLLAAENDIGAPPGQFDFELLIPAGIDVATLEGQVTSELGPQDAFFLIDRAIVERDGQEFLVARSSRGVLGTGVNVIYMGVSAPADICEGEYELLSAPEDPLRAASPDRIPIVFIHGWQAQLGSCDAWLSFDPGEKGTELFGHLTGRSLFKSFQFWRYSYPTLGPLGTAAERLALAVNHEFPDAEEIVLIGHSMGGLVARAAVERYGLRERASAVITLGTPHRGAILADPDEWRRLALWKESYLVRKLLLGTLGARDLKPSSDFITTLTEVSRSVDNNIYHTFAGDVDQTTLSPCGHDFPLCLVFEGGEIPFGVFPFVSLKLAGSVEVLERLGVGAADGIVEQSSAFLDRSNQETSLGAGYDHFEMLRGNHDGSFFPCEEADAASRLRECDDLVLGRVADIVEELIPIPTSGAILFSSNVDGSFDTWAISLDGSVRTNLSRVSHDPNSVLEDGGGKWSPDGSKILFTSNAVPGIPRKVFVMNADGTDARPLNNNTNTEVDPSWGPDGTKVYYGRNPRFPTTSGAGCSPCPHWEIYEFDLTTGQETRLTTNNSRDEHAVASPDGRFVAFRRAERPNDCCNPTSVWIMDVNGQNQRRLSPNNNRYETPLDWDPVNNKILTAWSSAVVLMGPDGTAEELINGASGAAFSPDGSTILTGVGADIYFLDIATRQLTPFLVEPGAQHPSDWRATGGATTFARSEMPRSPSPGRPVSAMTLVANGSFDLDPLGLEGCGLGIFGGGETVLGQLLALSGSGTPSQPRIRAWDGF